MRKTVFQKLHKIIGFMLVFTMAVSLGACGKSNLETDNPAQGNTAEDHSPKAESTEDKIVNIGMTDSISSVNPLMMDASEIMKTATAFQFLPLVDLNSELEFEGMLASSIATEDNIHFTVNIDPNASWSDGQPVTADDVVYTVLKLSSPVRANVSMALYAFEGIGDDGFTKEGATEISGIQAIDSKTVQFKTKYPMALTTFQNTYGRYILTLPKHVLENVADEDLAGYDWFNSPTVINGPYRITSVDLQHYVSYEANDKYWKGIPKINRLNIKIVSPAQLLTGLQSGEIDFIQQTTGNVLQEDYAGVEALGNVTVSYGAPVINQSIFFNTARVTDSRIRQAILYGIDRPSIITGLLNGKGEVTDGFLSSAGPFYDENLTPTVYDPEKAKELVAQAAADGWDVSNTLNFYVNSGDVTFSQAADYIAAKLQEIGIKVQVTTVDLSSLLSKAVNKDFDMLAIQYTYAPVDPYPDINWLLSETGWTGYVNDTVIKALEATQLTSDVDEIRKEYRKIDTIMQEEAPMISAYVISAIGAVNNRLVNAVPDVYGSFNNIHEWDVTQ